MYLNVYKLYCFKKIDFFLNIFRIGHNNYSQLLNPGYILKSHRGFKGKNNNSVISF